MNQLNFKSFIFTSEHQNTKHELAMHLIESGVDIENFNSGLQLIAEWGFNPFKTFGKSAATGAGAVLGSAFGSKDFFNRLRANRDNR